MIFVPPFLVIELHNWVLVEIVYDNCFQTFTIDWIFKNIYDKSRHPELILQSVFLSFWKLPEYIIVS